MTFAWSLANYILSKKLAKLDPRKIEWSFTGYLKMLQNLVDPLIRKRERLWGYFIGDLWYKWWDVVERDIGGLWSLVVGVEDVI
jgi:hypothetical protein